MKENSLIFCIFVNAILELETQMFFLCFGGFWWCGGFFWFGFFGDLGKGLSVGFF